MEVNLNRLIYCIKITKTDLFLYSTNNKLVTQNLIKFNIPYKISDNCIIVANINGRINVIRSMNLVVSHNNYIDLDNTIRNGSTKESPIYKNAYKLIKLLCATILTNNAYKLPEEILGDLKMPDVLIITPIHNVKVGKTPFIIGNKPIKEYLGHQDLDISRIGEYTDVIICHNIFNESITTLGIVRYLIERLQTVYIYENLEFASIEESIEAKFPLDISVPFTGSFLKMIEYKGNIIDFGKINFKDHRFGVMIGDLLETDGEVCFRNNGVFIHILGDESSFEFNGKYFTVGNVDILYEALTKD